MLVCFLCFKNLIKSVNLTARQINIIWYYFIIIYIIYLYTIRHCKSTRIIAVLIGFIKFVILYFFRRLIYKRKQQQCKGDKSR